MAGFESAEARSAKAEAECGSKTPDFAPLRGASSALQFLRPEHRGQPPAPAVVVRLALIFGFAFGFGPGIVGRMHQRDDRCLRVRPLAAHGGNARRWSGWRLLRRR